MGSCELPSNPFCTSVCVCMLISEVVAQHLVGNRVSLRVCGQCGIRKVRLRCRSVSDYLHIGLPTKKNLDRVPMVKRPSDRNCRSQFCFSDVFEEDTEFPRMHGCLEPNCRINSSPLKNKHTIHPTGLEPASGLRFALRKE